MNLGKKVGPLPVGVWGLAIVGGLGVAVVIRRRAAADTAATEAGEYADAYAPWESGAGSGTPQGAGNLYDAPDAADDGYGPAPSWAADLADSVTDLGDGLGALTYQVEGLYYTVPTPGGPGTGSGSGGGRRDTGKGPGAKPAPGVRVFRERFDDKNNRQLRRIERQAQARAKAVRQGGIEGRREARALAVAINRRKAARRERAENNRKRREARR